MKQFRLPLLVFLLLVTLCAFVSAKGGTGRSKDGKGRGRFGKFNVKSISTCMGQPVDLTSQLDAFVEECLDSRLQEIQEARAEDGETKKSEKKRLKKKEKLEKKMRRKCTAECEWKTFDLIPEINGTGNASSSYPAVEIPTFFLSAFPKDAQQSLKSRMVACYNRTSPLPLIEGKRMKFFKMCKKNNRLMRCLGKALRQTCNGKGNIQPTNGTDDTAPAVKSELENVGGNDDDDDDDDVDDDADEDEAEDGDETTTGISVTPIRSTPGSHVDTSQPITK